MIGFRTFFLKSRTSQAVLEETGSNYDMDTDDTGNAICKAILRYT